MRKSLLFLMALAILAIALPAQARSHHSRENCRPRGWQPRIVVGYNYYNPGYYGSYYGGSGLEFQEAMAYNRQLTDQIVGNAGYYANRMLHPNMVVDYTVVHSDRSDRTSDECEWRMKVADKANLKGREFTDYVDHCIGKTPEPHVASVASVVPTAAPPVPAARKITLINHTGECIWVLDSHLINPDGSYAVPGNLGMKLSFRKPNNSKCNEYRTKLFVAPDIFEVICH